MDKCDYIKCSNPPLPLYWVEAFDEQNKMSVHLTCDGHRQYLFNCLKGNRLIIKSIHEYTPV